MSRAILIPMRGGSKGVPRKNLRRLAGRPLFEYVCDAAINTGIPTFVSTEDSEIAAHVHYFNREITVVDRPLSLATDESSTEDVIDHFISTYPAFTEIVLLQVTLPLTESKDIIDSIALFESCPDTNSLLSVTRNHHFLWTQAGFPLNYNPSDRPRRQDWAGNFIENGAIYIFTVDSFRLNKSRLSPPALLFEMPSAKSLEIDTERDFALIEALLES